MNRYFGGQSVMDGHIRALQANTFAEFVERFIDKAVPLNMTRDAFHDQPKKVQSRIKSVAYFTAVSFKPGATERKDENAEALQLACLDFDEGTTAQNIFEAPGVVADQLNGLNYVLYTTASHLPDRARLRLVVDLDNLPLESHKHVVGFLCASLGIPDGWEGEKESKVLSQPMYRPVIYQGEDGGRFSAVVSSRVSGRALTLEELGESPLPQNNILRRYAADFEEMESIETLPLAGVTVLSVKAPLERLDPDCEYYEWVKVAAALRHQFRKEEEAQEAFELFDEWSARGTKYPGTENVYRKWNSFRPCPRGRAPVTLRSLYKAAMEHGWDSTLAARTAEKSFETWLAQPWSFVTLNNAYPAMVAAQPFRDRNQDFMLCTKVRERMLEMSGSSPSVALLFKKVKDEDTTLVDRETKPDWVRPFVYISGSDKFVNTNTMTHYEVDSFNRAFARHLMPAEIEEGHSGRPSVMPADFATNIVHIQVAEAEHYDPRTGGTEPIYVTDDGRVFLNTYRANYPDPDYSKMAEAGEIFEDHLANIIAEPWIRKVVLDFLATCVQSPGLKIRWAILFQSVEGVGKGLIAEIMAAILGDGNCKIINNSVVAGQWNDWGLGAHLLIAEEVHSSGQNRKEVGNRLKELISNERISINKRNTTAFEADNTCNLIAYTNSEDAIFADQTSRRWFVIKSPLRDTTQLQRMVDQGYFDHVARLKGELAAGFRAYMLSHKISPSFNPSGRAPHTEYLDEVVRDVQNPMVQALQDVIEDNTHPYICSTAISVNALVSLFGPHTKHNNILRSMGFQRLDNRLRIGERQTHVWVHRSYSRSDLGKVGEFFKRREEMLQKALDV